MPTVVQISIEVNSGSVGRIAEQIGEILIENGWKSYITYARNNLPSKSKVIKIGSSYDVYMHVLQTRLLDNHCFASKKATKRLIRDLEELEPDIIHMHHLHGYFINIEILFAYLKKKSIPVVWTFHDCWAFTGRCAYFEFIDCNKWKTECHTCPQLNEYPKTLFFDKSTKNFKLKKEIFNEVDNLTIVPVSNWLGDLVKESFLSNYPIKVIQNGIDTNVFSPLANLSDTRNKYNLENKFVILGVASTWDARKGLDFFVELNKVLDSDETIILVGLSKEQVKHLPDGVIGIERTESVQDLASLYSVADVFVNPTLEDTFPTTNLESLSCGTPVITFRTGGSVESVSEETGLIVEKGDVSALYKAIKEIKLNTKSFYTHNCRARALALYNKNERFTEYLDLYKNLIDGK